MANKYLDLTGLAYFWEKIKSYVSSKADIGHTHTIAECQDALVSKTYTGVVRSSTTYSSPYTPSYFYFGQFIPSDLDKPAHVTYHLKAYGTSNSSYLLDSIVRWDISTDGIYKAYYIWNNLNSTSYYPFGYHTLYRSNKATISASDGCYFGGYFGTSTSYGQNPTSVARTIEVEILEAENCTASLTDSVIFFDDTSNMPSNLVHTNSSVAFNTTNFTAVNVTVQSGLQETGDANSSALGYTIRRNSGNYLSKGACYRYMLLLSYSETEMLPVNNTSNSVSTSKTLTTETFDPFGPIFYYSSTTTVSSGSAIAITSCWTQYALDLRYSFNEGTTLTSSKDVYIVAVPQSNGRAVLAADPISQTLPTTEDGYIYIYLGHAYSTYQITLALEHPIYYYKDSSLRIWTNAAETDLSSKQDVISDLDTIRSGAALGATALQSYTETDPVFTASAASGITSTDISTWNAKADTSDIPTKVSDLTNDSGYITNAGVTSFNGSTGAVTYTAPVTSVNGSTGAVTVDVPTAVSELTNDSGYLTEHQDISGKADVSALASYTPTSGFATINGASITGGGDITITAGDSTITTLDSTPTSGSTNPVQSGGVYNAIEGGYYY